MTKKTKKAAKPRPKTSKPVTSWRVVNMQKGWVSLEMPEELAKERAASYGHPYRAARITITYEVRR